MPNYVVEIQDLTKVYRERSSKPVRALDGLSLQVEQGELLGLLGPNGAGKSTLINILSTLTEPTSGSARVNGFDVVKDPLAVRRSIAVVLQTSSAEAFLSVWENFVSYGLFQGLSLADARRRAAQAVDVFELGEFTRVKCQDLSGGNKRRVQSAKAFLAETPILFLDEATTGMDAVIKRRVVELIREQAKNGRTILLTTQVLSEAEELCDEIVIVDHGKIAAQGDLASLKALSKGFYNVALSFGSVEEELLNTLRRAQPSRMDVKRNTISMTLRGSEAEVLARLALVAERWPIMSVEITGASLEDIFFELLGKPAVANSAIAGGAAD
jgi:ABC-2 type transport system ATP-binding protein